VINDEGGARMELEYIQKGGSTAKDDEDGDK
jgi:YD repeat-containing protein